MDEVLVPTLQQLPLETVKIIYTDQGMRLNPRGEPGNIDDLKESMRVAGQVQAIGVLPDDLHPGEYWLIYGERRVKALTELCCEDPARFGTVLAVIHNDVAIDDIPELRKMQLAENAGRQDVPWLAVADALRAMADAGWTMIKAAGIVGISPDRARFVLDLADESAVVREAVGSGKLDIEGYRTIRAQSDDIKNTIAEEALEGEGRMRRAEIRAKVEKARTNENDIATVLDSTALIMQAQGSVSGILALLDNKTQWPADAKPAIEWQFNRLIARLTAEGLLDNQTPSIESVEASVECADAMSYANDVLGSAWGDVDDLLAEDEEMLAEARQWEEDVTEESAIPLPDEAYAQPASVEIVAHPDAPAMKYTVKVPGYPAYTRRFRNEQTMQAYIASLQQQGVVV